jgi:predicted metal-dependent phosphoesterase TrpH
MFCDLHTHSTASDGTVRPELLPQLARDAGLHAIALTDHDTTAGLPACEAACKALNINFVPGIEISADPLLDTSPDPASDDRPRVGTLHILGLFVRHDDPKLAHVHDRMLDARLQRNPQIIARLNALGVNISYDDVLALAAEEGTEIIGRPHIAQVLIKLGHVQSTKEAFTKYLGQGKPAYVRKDLFTAADAIDAIHHAGGLASLAHPVQLKITEPDAIHRYVAQLKSLGLDAIEARHPDHTPEVAASFAQLAERLNLLTTGGSDFHGRRKDIPLGSQRVPLSVFDALRSARSSALT